MKKHVGILLLMVLCGFRSAPAAEPLTLSLDEAVLIAVRDNRDMLMRAEDVAKAKAAIREATSGLYPTLTFTGGWSYSRGLFQKDFGQTATQLGSRQVLFRSGKTVNSIRSKEYAYAASQALYDRAKLETVLAVRKAFYALLLAEELRTLAKGVVENTKAHLSWVEARFESGEASASDVLGMKQSLASVQEAYEASVNQVEANAALLEALLYLDAGVVVKPVGDFAYDPKEFAYDDAFLKAMETRPEIRQLEAELQAARRQVAIAKADARPAITASWDYYSRSHGGISGITTGTSKNWNDNNTIGLIVSWPVFDGWLTASKVEQARVELKRAELNKQKGIRDIATEVTDAYGALKDAMAAVRSSEAEVARYVDMRDVVHMQYKEGVTSSLETDDADLKYQVSLFNKRQAIYDYLIAKFTFEKAMGGP